MRTTLLVLLALMLPGCAAMSLDPPNRWVNNNTLYSDKLPRLEIVVNKSLPFKNLKESDKLITSERGSSHTGKMTSEYFFKGNDARLKIKITSLPQGANWYMIPSDYSKYKDNITSGSKKIHGMQFATGIMAVSRKGQPGIVKIYGRVVGETTRYQIYYSERLTEEWENYDPSLFTESDRGILSAFNERADKSFIIRDYSPQKQRSISQKKPDTKNSQRLAKLESLYLDGILSKEEYEAKRDNIVNSMLDE